MKVSKYVLCGIALTAIGCGSGGGGGAYKPVESKKTEIVKVAEGEGASLFPVAVGNQWTYKSQSTATSAATGNTALTQTITLEMKKVDETPQGKMIEIEVREEDVVKSTQIWKIDDTGVYQVSVLVNGKTTTFTPPQPVLIFPIVEKQEREFTGVGPSALGAQTNFKGKVMIDGPQITQTVTDEVSAYRVVANYELSGEGVDAQTKKKIPLKGTFESVSFFAPKVGLVRLQQTVKGAAGGEIVTMTLAQSTVK